MKFKIVFFAIILFVGVAKGQLVSYSPINSDDVKDLKYEIIGKLSGNIQIYKNNRNKYSITLYDAQMQEVTIEKLDFLPETILNENFLLFQDSYYMFYEYQRKNVVYCMAVKFDKMGKKISDPIELDTTKVSFLSSTKIYTVINSEDKQHIMVIKIGKPEEEKTNLVTTTLYDKQLQLIKKSVLTIPMKEKRAMLSEFQLDNSGDLVFLKTNAVGRSEIINKLTFITKPAAADTIHLTDVNLNGIYLDDIRLKVDNYNRHYLINSLFSKEQGGDVDGFFCYLWDIGARKELLNTNITFTDDFKDDVKTGGATKAALNSFYLRNIVVKRDGGFLLAAESAYSSTSDNDPFNRWNGFGSPYSGYNNYSVYGMNGMFYNPYAPNYNTITRYFSNNVIMLSVNLKGKLEWSNIIRKSQEDDNTENFISYGTMNTGDKVHFLFNMQSKRQNTLAEQSISPDGQLTRSPAFNSFDKSYEFMPRFTKQTGLRQIVLPCRYRSYICFAKIDF